MERYRVFLARVCWQSSQSSKQLLVRRSGPQLSLHSFELQTMERVATEVDRQRA